MSDNPEGGQQQTSPPAQPPPAKGNNDSSAALIAKVEDLNRQLTEAQGQVKTLTAERNNFETAHQQLTEKNSALTNDFTVAQDQVKQLNGQVTTFQEQINQLTSQVGQVTQTNSQTKAELDLFKMISDNPDYHGLIGIVNSLKVVPDQEQQKGILDTAANAWKQNNQQLIQMMQAGATPPAGAGNNQTPAKAGPQTKDEISTRLQQIIGLPAHQQEAAQLQARLVGLQYGQQQQKPA